MKEERLLDAFGQIDEKFIEEADPEKKRESNQSKSNNKRAWVKWGAMAACGVVVVGITIPALNRDKGWTQEANEAVLENDITEGKPETEEGEEAEVPAGQGYFNANIIEIYDDFLLVECTEAMLGGIETGSRIKVEARNTLSDEKVPNLKVGDSIRVLYIGDITSEDVLALENTVSIFLLNEHGEILYAQENSESESAVVTEDDTKDHAGLGYATDTEPMQEIPLEKAQSIELFPTEMLDGYVLDGSVEVYDKKVVVARFYNTELDDTLTIRIYDKEYFNTQNDDVEFHSIIYQGESSSFIYFEGEKKIIRYKFSNSDIANHEEFFDMVYSADFFKNGNIPEIKEG